MLREVRVFAPGTVANLGPGFDLLGLAVEGRGDTVVARRTPAEGVRVAVITGDDGRLPLQEDRNTAAIAAREVLRRTAGTGGVELEVHKGMPIGSGLGSSAASAAAAAFAVNTLLGSPLRRTELVPACVEAEAAVAGRHADNVAPAILGGLVLVRSLSPLKLLRLPVPEDLTVIVVTPAFEVSTRAAREALPAEIPIGAMVRNGARLATLVSACYSGDVALLAECLFDEVVTPARAALTPGSDAVMDAALGAGALGASMSGSGPSIFALAHHPARGEAIRAAMVRAFEDAGLAATGLVSRADAPGARLV